MDDQPLVQGRTLVGPCQPCQASLLPRSSPRSSLAVVLRNYSYRTMSSGGFQFSERVQWDDDWLLVPSALVSRDFEVQPNQSNQGTSKHPALILAPILNIRTRLNFKRFMTPSGEMRGDAGRIESRASLPHRFIKTAHTAQQSFAFLNGNRLLSLWIVFVEEGISVPQQTAFPVEWSGQVMIDL